ncbi:DMT family transporter [Desulfotomaculum sp. 1211_IL3151]|uniref:DMT family transporter n=1 Tax=Desulfotomaculum sp. 1211_IL3151 TaxID=3084055 RepID=UPI002FDB6576
MDAKLIALIIAATSGLTMALQGTMNSALGKVVGLWETTFIVHAVGTVVVGILVFVCRLGDCDLGKWASAPWYTYLGGVLSVLIIYMVARSMPVVGVASATTAIIVGQVLTAAAIDHLGIFGFERIPFNWYHLAGTLLMAGGAFLLLKK